MFIGFVVIVAVSGFEQGCAVGTFVYCIAEKILCGGIRKNCMHRGFDVAEFDKAKGYKFQALYSQALTFRFTTEAGALEYLNGKRFEVDPAQIWFLEEFQ